MTDLAIKLVVSGDFNPEVFTTTLGINPTRSVNKGEPFSPKIPKLAIEDRWEYSISNLESAIDIDSGLAQLASIFSPLNREVTDFKMKHSVKYTVLCYFSKSIDEAMPSIFFTHGTLSQLGSLGFDIDVDIIEI